MTLRERVAELLWDRCAITTGQSFEFADSILALINEERCEWSKQADGGFLTSCRGYWLPGCWITDYPTDKCPCCGRKIEVKDEG